MEGNSKHGELIAEIRDNAEGMGMAISVLALVPDIDQRALSIARTHLQTGFMWLLRAANNTQTFV